MAETSPFDQEKHMLPTREWRPLEPAYVEKAQLARRAGRHARYQQGVSLHEQGMKPKEIARLLDLSDRTVQRWLANGSFPEARKRRKRQSCFDAFASYMLKQWQEGERRGVALLRDLREQGYTGSERTLYRYLEVLQQTEVTISTNLHRLKQFSATTAVWLFVHDPKSLDEVEQEDLAAFCQVSATLKQAYRLVQDFLDMVQKREGERLDEWLETVTKSGISELQSFASGIEKDKDAVRAGLTWSINNGMVEGHVNKLKLIKRQGYDRTSFSLQQQCEPLGCNARRTRSGSQTNPSNCVAGGGKDRSSQHKSSCNAGSRRAVGINRRMKRRGMSWLRRNATSVVAWRVAWLNEDWMRPANARMYP
ncbi:transposase [Dictyobacter kobayashii]|uniref:transposase n=1 Tax=Dictyobacter kobayashii TaxID=2014872 RepID=UPI001386FA68|nr:transposase [Dictyobacter kobayashii]